MSTNATSATIASRTSRPAARSVGVAALLALIAATAFAPAVFNGFIAAYDDGDNFLRNPNFRGLGPAHVRWAWTTRLSGVYQPLAWMLFEAEYAAWGLDPAGYHLVSVAFHALNTVALFVLALDLSARIGSEPRAWRMTSAALAAGLFAVHPLRVEVVAWASCQPYLPCSLLALGAVLAYLRAHPVARPPQPAWLVVSWVLLAGALLFKAIAVTIPAVLVALDVYPLRRLGRARDSAPGPPAGRAWVEKVPFLALGLAFVAIAADAKRRGIRLNATPDGALARATQATYATCFYLARTFWPAGLSADYPLPHRWYALDPPFVASLAVAVAITAAVVLLARRWPGLAVAWAAFLITLAPNAGLVRTNDQVAADRYSYLPSMVVAVFTGALLARAGCHARARRPIVVGGIVALAALTVLTWRQCQTWHDDLAMYTRAVAANPRNARAHTALGLAWEARGRLDEAESAYRRAEQLARWMPHSANNLGLLRLRAQRYVEARAYFQEATARDPTGVDAYANMGLLCAQQGRWAESVAWYERASRLGPLSGGAYANMGEALQRLGRYDDAVAQYTAALGLDPYNASLRRSLEEALRKGHRSAPASVLPRPSPASAAEAGAHSGAVAQ